MKKKILKKLVPVIIVLLIIIVIIIMNFYKTNQASEKMLEYLSQEYNCLFKINLIAHNIYSKPLFSFDESENNLGDESFSFTINSMEDNISFKAFYYVKKDGTESFYDSYKENKYFIHKNNEVLEYIKSLINNVSEKDYDLKISNGYTNFVNNYYLISNDNLNDCLKDIKYIENLINIRNKVFNDLKNDEKLIPNKRSDYSTLKYEIKIAYNDNLYVVINDEGVYVLNEKKTGKYEIYNYVQEILKIEIPSDENNTTNDEFNIDESNESFEKEMNSANDIVVADEPLSNDDKDINNEKE